MTDMWFAIAGGVPLAGLSTKAKDAEAWLKQTYPQARVVLVKDEPKQQDQKR